MSRTFNMAGIGDAEGSGYSRAVVASEMPDVLDSPPNNDNRLFNVAVDPTKLFVDSHNVEPDNCRCRL